MVGDGEGTFREGSHADEKLDPLGILGWVIGGKYKIRSYIGGGGFGEVYDGFNANLPEQKLVIKFFKRVQSRDKFAKEAKILCLLDHPNILRIIDYLPEEGALVVPFIDGKDGGRILKESGPLPEKLYLRVARTMTEALAYAHERKIAHRDLKPGNILIDKNEHVYLIDFGIAKEMGGSATKTAYVALTPLFAAPERQSGDQDYNPFLSDIYEMGVTLFNFATNEMPYRNPSNPNASEWGGSATKRLSPQLRRILKKATHPNPSERYQSAAKLAEEMRNLEQAYGGEKKPRYLTIAASLLVLLLAAVVIKKIITKAPQSPPKSETAATTKTTEPPKVIPSAQKPPVDTSKKIIKSDIPPITEVKKTEEKPSAEKRDTTKAEPTAPAAQVPTLLVHVTPQYDVSLFVDGKEKSLDRRMEMAAGPHEIKIIHPDYPVVIDTVDVTVDRSKQYNLSEKFSGVASKNFRVGISPSDLPDGLLQVSFNGKKYQYKNDELPILDLKKLSGRWQMRFDIISSAGTAAGASRIDSVVTFPYGGGPRIRLSGSGGVMDIGAADWQSVNSIDLLIYWSSK
jgi:serine/threonine protein kinase